jgi:hypothetical protein
VVLKLAEYDFEIEHKARKKHVNADCLSRHIASVATGAGNRKSPDDESGEALTRKAVFAEQQQDPYCKEIMEEIRAGKGSKFCISDDGLLHVGPNLESGRLVVPNKLIRPVIEMHHKMKVALELLCSSNATFILFNSFPLNIYYFNKY